MLFLGPYQYFSKFLHILADIPVLVVSIVSVFIYNESKDFLLQQLSFCLGLVVELNTLN